jgi:hypothetical protein
MQIIEHTTIWRRTLAQRDICTSGPDPHSALRARTRSAFEAFRRHAAVLAGEIPQQLRELTVHDITHIDALWQYADMIVGEDYPLTPTEAMVLGGAFLLHDLGLALASYPLGMAELEAQAEWKDAASVAFRKTYGRFPSPEELSSLGEAIRTEAVEVALRLRHAKQAERLAVVSYRHTNRDASYFLIEDTDLRQTYGTLIGRIAYSHWWPLEELQTQFGDQIGAFVSGPSNWTVDPLKLALIVRVADACHLDARRAPGFLRALRKPTGTSELHWRFQEYVQIPYVKGTSLVFSATKEFPFEDMEAWWLGHEMLELADRELRDADMVLRDTGRPIFLVNCIAGARDPKRLSRHFRTTGWKPVGVAIKVNDVASLIRNLGGTGLYGRNPRVPLRELIQNARDAVVARRIKEQRRADWGEINVRLLMVGNGYRIEVQDTGIGMSEELLTGPFLDFGTSYWTTQLMLREHPGLVSKGFDPQGRFGIGFFSAFMWGNHVKVVTRRPEDGVDSTLVLEFLDGLSRPPILRNAEGQERLSEPGTVVQVWLDIEPEQTGGLLSGGQIESRRAVGNPIVRERPWSLSDMCAWLCPAIDVNVFVERDTQRSLSIAASDWKTIPAGELLRRLLLHRDKVDEIYRSPQFRVIADRVRDITDPRGQLLGRGVLKRFFCATGPGEEYLNDASTVTAGSFRTVEQIDILGLLIGRAEQTSRYSAKPLAFEDPETLADWATEQAELLDSIFSDPSILSHHAQLIRKLGGHTRNLPIARTAEGLQSFASLAQSHDLLNEVFLEEDDWGVAGARFGPLSANRIGVSSGRMKALWDTSVDKDPSGRAKHPRWDQYWMSLWGATIEALAQAWRVPLQEVLECSDFYPNDIQIDQRGGFVNPIIRWADVIRNPRSVDDKKKSS